MRSNRRSVLLLSLMLLLPTTAALGGSSAPAAAGDAPSAAPWVHPDLHDLAARTPHDPAVFLLGFPSVPEEGTVEELGQEVLDLLAFRHVPVVAVVATPHQALDLVDTPGLLSLVPDRPLTLHQLPSAEHTNWASTGDGETRSDLARALGFDGSGVGVAVVDTGINGVPPHPGLLPDELGGPVVQNVEVLLGRDPGTLTLPSPTNLYLEDQVSTDESGGHGTHVAGIIAGQGTSDGAFHGRAPGAQLVGISTGAGLSILYAVAAYDYILEHQEAYNIRVVNNSYGATGPYQPLDPLMLAVEAADEAGILSVFSAGNSGPEERTLDTYSQSPHALAVGAATPGGAVATFSSRGSPDSGKPGPDLVAPGWLTISARSQALSGLEATARTPIVDSAAVPAEDLYHYRVISGTSMASPQVAAIAALLLEADASLTPAELRTLLTETARPLQGYGVAAQGAGLVDANAALRTVLGLDVAGGDWVRPLVIDRDGEVHRYPFHGAVLGANIEISAFRQENKFPVRTPNEGMDVTFTWQPLTPAGEATVETEPLSFTLLGPDGAAVVQERFPDLAARTVTYHLDNETIAAHNPAGWSAGPWTAVVFARGGIGTYDVEVAVRYEDGTLPPVERTEVPPPPPPAELTPRGPIAILSDADFTAENGVVAGTGTADDPYLIEGWEITPNDGAGIAIGGTGEIGQPGTGTSQHVLIRNVRVYDSPNWCIMLDSADHVTIQGATIDGCNWGVYAKGDTEDLAVLDSTFAFNSRSIALYGVQDGLVRGNTVTDAVDGGIIASQGVVGLSPNVASSNIRFVENTLLGDRADISVATSAATDIQVIRNRLGDGGRVVLSSGTAANVVAGTEWLDGEQRIIQSVIGIDPGAIVPVNTIVDAGSDRSPDASGQVCFDDARIDPGPGEVVDIVLWEFGDGTTVEGEANPCHTYADGSQAYEARVLVTLQPTGGDRYTLEDTVRVG